MTIRDEATQALARVDALHTALTHLVLEGGDLRQIAAEAAHVLGVGVLLTSTDGRERASAMSDENRAALTDARLVDATGRIRVERLKDDGRLPRRAARSARSGWPPAAPTWRGWSACARTARSPRRTCTRSSGWRSWPPC